MGKLTILSWMVLTAGAAEARQPEWPTGGAGVEVILVGRQANSDKRRRCREHLANAGVRSAPGAAVKAYVDVEPGRNYLKIVSASRGTVHEERLPGTWNVGDLCRDAAAKAQRFASSEQPSEAAPAAGDPGELVTAGMRAFVAGQYAEAVRDFQGAYHKTRDARLHRKLGRAYLAKGMAAGSAADLKQAREHLYLARDQVNEDVDAELKLLHEEMGKLVK